MLPPLRSSDTDFGNLVEEVLALARANGGQQADALRSVIERYHLLDHEGIRLFSATAKAERDAVLAA